VVVLVVVALSPPETVLSSASAISPLISFRDGARLWFSVAIVCLPLGSDS
jgi:hypothetical protein